MEQRGSAKHDYFLCKLCANYGNSARFLLAVKHPIVVAVRQALAPNRPGRGQREHGALFGRVFCGDGSNIILAVRVGRHFGISLRRPRQYDPSDGLLPEYNEWPARWIGERAFVQCKPVLLALGNDHNRTGEPNDPYGYASRPAMRSRLALPPTRFQGSVSELL